MLKYLTIGIIFALVGCSTVEPPKPVIIETVVPVVVKPPVGTLPERPNLAINDIPQQDLTNPGIVANAYRTSLVQMRAYALELETLLKVIADDK